MVSLARGRLALSPGNRRQVIRRYVGSAATDPRVPTPTMVLFETPSPESASRIGWRREGTWPLQFIC